MNINGRNIYVATFHSYKLAKSFCNRMIKPGMVFLGDPEQETYLVTSCPADSERLIKSGYSPAA